MSSENLTIDALVKKQEAEKQELAAGVYEAWQPVKEEEKRLLSSYGGKYENAPENVQQAVNRGREEYFKEWGSDGRLAAFMADRHEREREKAIERDNLLKQIRSGGQGKEGQER